MSVSGWKFSSKDGLPDLRKQVLFVVDGEYHLGARHGKTNPLWYSKVQAGLFEDREVTCWMELPDQPK